MRKLILLITVFIVPLSCLIPKLAIGQSEYVPLPKFVPKYDPDQFFYTQQVLENRYNENFDNIQRRVDNIGKVLKNLLWLGEHRKDDDIVGRVYKSRDALHDLVQKIVDGRLRVLTDFQEIDRGFENIEDYNLHTFEIFQKRYGDDYD